MLRRPTSRSKTPIIVCGTGHSARATYHSVTEFVGTDSSSCSSHVSIASMAFPVGNIRRISAMALIRSILSVISFVFLEQMVWAVEICLSRSTSTLRYAQRTQARGRKRLFYTCNVHLMLSSALLQERPAKNDMKQS